MKQDGDKLTCEMCGWKGTAGSVPLRHRCFTGEMVTWAPEGFQKRNGPSRGPSLLQKTVNFGGAVVQHIGTGMRQATDDQVAERFAKCLACPLFKQATEGRGMCTHQKCGCNISEVGSEQMLTPNKLRWADQACPIGVWGPIKSELPSPPPAP